MSNHEQYMNRTYTNMALLVWRIKSCKSEGGGGGPWQQAFKARLFAQGGAGLGSVLGSYQRPKTTGSTITEENNDDAT